MRLKLIEPLVEVRGWQRYTFECWACKTVALVDGTPEDFITPTGRHTSGRELEPPEPVG